MNIMTVKILYCEECSEKVAKVNEGSLIRKGSVMICSRCNAARTLSKVGNGHSRYESSIFDDIFGKFGKS